MVRPTGLKVTGRQLSALFFIALFLCLHEAQAAAAVTNYSRQSITFHNFDDNGNITNITPLKTIAGDDGSAAFSHYRKT